MTVEELVFKIDQLWGSSKIKEIVDRLSTTNEVDESKLKTMLQTTFSAVTEQLQDGFQLHDAYPILSAALHDLMEIAENISGASGEEKLVFVTETFTSLYNLVDKGTDGTKNRIDIPWVPQVAEDFIEKRVLPIIIRFAVEAVVSAWNAKKSA